MKHIWLCNPKKNIVDVRVLKDAAGQPLVFEPSPKTSSRRLVTETVYNHPIIQSYLKRRLLVEGLKGGSLPREVKPVALKLHEGLAPVEEVSVLSNPVPDGYEAEYEDTSAPEPEQANSDLPLMEPELSLELVEDSTESKPKKSKRRSKNS